MSQVLGRTVNKTESLPSVEPPFPKGIHALKKNEAGKEDLEQNGGEGVGRERVCRILSRWAEKASHQEGSKEGSCAEIRSCISDKGFYFEKECYLVGFDHRSDTLWFNF